MYSRESFLGIYFKFFCLNISCNVSFDIFPEFNDDMKTVLTTLFIDHAVNLIQLI